MADVLWLILHYGNQCFGSGLDPGSIRSVDPDSESGSRKAKMTHRNKIKKLGNFFMFCSAGCSLLMAEASLVAWASFVDA